jgi:hypothetical protein
MKDKIIDINRILQNQGPDVLKNNLFILTSMPGACTTKDEIINNLYLFSYK